MAARKRRNKRSQLIRKVKQSIKYEALALFTYGAMLTGTITFYMVFKRSWEIDAIDWIWLILAVPLFGLPRVLDRLRNSHEPSYIARFADAFREGFLLLSSIASDLFRWTAKVRGLLENLRQKEKILNQTTPSQKKSYEIVRPVVTPLHIWIATEESQPRGGNHFKNGS